MALIHAEEDEEDRAAKRPVKARAANRGALPEHLPRIEGVIEPDSLVCTCGNGLHCIGEDRCERLAYCRAHARRKLFEITRTGPAPIAQEGLRHMADLYKIEADIRGNDPVTRLTARQSRSAPLIADIEAWLNTHRSRVAAKSPLGEALNYIARYWAGLCLFLDDGRIELYNNSVERTIRPIALNGKNALFAGHDTGAQNWATIASLIETCKLNRVDPFALPFIQLRSA